MKQHRLSTTTQLSDEDTLAFFEKKTIDFNKSMVFFDSKEKALIENIDAFLADLRMVKKFLLECEQKAEQTRATAVADRIRLQLSLNE